MHPSVIQRVFRYIQSRGMCVPGESVGVAVSGGSDSVALLRILTDLSTKLGVRLAVAHFNHLLRGDESEADEEFVASLARKLGLPFFSGRGDVRGVALKEGWNLEDAGRRLRYEFFASLVRQGRVQRIAVGHTADDQAETVLGRLMRGTGPAGLGGIYPVKGPVIRPLLDIRRQELRQYLIGINQDWREDSSNADTQRMRSYLRHEVLPILEREVDSTTVRHLGRLAALAREDETFWRAFVKAHLEKSAHREGRRIGIRCADLLAPFRASGLSGSLPQEAHIAVTRRLVRGMVQMLRGDCRELTATHVNGVLRLATTHSSGRRVNLPGAIVERDFEWLWFSSAPSEERMEPGKTSSAQITGSLSEFSLSIQLGSTGESTIVVVPEIRRRFCLKVIDWSGGERDTKVDQGGLDRDLLGSPLVLRNWRPGDSFRPRGRRSAHKLKHLLQASRVAVGERLGWPVLTSGETLVWVRGLPPAAEFATRETTQTGVVIAEEGI